MKKTKDLFLIKFWRNFIQTYEVSLKSFRPQHEDTITRQQKLEMCFCTL